ncbi:MAG: 23S rRNA (pseudouridine(1915)-N(3))-methyltransferase RlmH [Deltaproteobacteria bacterium]|nr:23S rRNA (pseudouridine(1915)-N(3))-methyltransferase RlmH [Deltaproteobacteria bacterium]MDZ4224491.1 23S rRNA (pseudouridine(1915)-N(3))-methyltransferase RlmH [bacterium]
MKVKILTVGKLSLKPAGELVLEYQKRLKHYLPVEIVAMKSVAELSEKLKSADFLVVMDERGKSFTSVAFAKWIESKKMDATKSLIFLVGPGEGLPKEIQSKANLLLRLSDFTLQHELALVILMEQIYRACTILKGEPYHK